MKRKLDLKNSRTDAFIVAGLLIFVFFSCWLGRTIYIRNKWTKMTFDYAYSIASSTGKYGYIASENDGDPVAMKYDNVQDIYILVTRAGPSLFSKGPKTWEDDIHIEFIDGSSLDFIRIGEDRVFMTFKNDEVTYNFRLGVYIKYSDISKKCSLERNDEFLHVDDVVDGQ